MALTAWRTSRTWLLPCLRGFGRPVTSHPTVATASAPIAVPASAPVAFLVMTSPASVPPTRTAASVRSSAAMAVNRCCPWRMP